MKKKIIDRPLYTYIHGGKLLLYIWHCFLLVFLLFYFVGGMEGFRILILIKTLVGSETYYSLCFNRKVKRRNGRQEVRPFCHLPDSKAKKPKQCSTTTSPGLFLNQPTRVLVWTITLVISFEPRHGFILRGRSVDGEVPQTSFTISYFEASIRSFRSSSGVHTRVLY